MTVRVPGPRVASPTTLPHVLVVEGRGEYADASIEHPEGCVRACHWWPDTAEAAWQNGGPEYACYVQRQVDDCGLDSIDGEVDGVVVSGVDGWRALRPGRYVLEPWYQPPGWAGSEPIEADGGLALVGRERPRPWDRVRWSRLRADVRRARLGVNVPGGRLALRGPAQRAYFSERNRSGCVVLPLGRGWRIVVVRRRRW